MKKILSFVFILFWVTVSGEGLPFVWKSKAENNKLTITAEVAPGHYFYRSTLVFDVQDSKKKQVYPAVVPQGKIVADDMFGKVEVYPAGKWKWVFESDGYIVRACVNFQGCRENSAENPGMCFMPETVDLLPDTSLEARLETEMALLPVKLEGFKFERKLTGLQSKTSFLAWLAGKKSDSTENVPADMGFWALALLALLGGLGLNLTPCVLPMLPITLAIIGAGSSSGKRGFFRGLLYGSGMALSYGLLGLAVILAGARFGELQSSMIFNLVIAFVFVLLGLAMLGVFNLDFSGATAKIRPSQLFAGKEITAFVMGSVTALLAGACIAPVVVSVLLFASARYHTDGVAALFLPFLLGVGMALPWPLAGAGLAILPRPGKFMLKIKYIFAGIIFCAALWYGYTAWQLRPGIWDAEKEIRLLDTALTEAALNKRSVLIDFQASWCKNCHAMEKILSEPEVAEKLKDFQVVRFHAEDLTDPRIAGLLKKWDIPGLPAFVLLTPEK